jgi:hypothetical protein
MMTLGVCGFLAFVVAMYWNHRSWVIQEREREEMFKKGYYCGYMDDRLGRDRDWEKRFEEEEMRD